MLIVDAEIDLWLNPESDAAKMTRTISLAGTTLELIEARGRVGFCCSCTAGEGLAPEAAPGPRSARKTLSRHRAVASGIRRLAADRWWRGRRPTTLSTYTSISPPELGLEDAVLVGADLGGWDRGRDDGPLDRPRFSRLGFLGRPPRQLNCAGPRTERDIADMHGIEARRISASRLGRAGQGRGRLHRAAPTPSWRLSWRGREAFALYGWKPYMHKRAPEALAAPESTGRPCLLWGAQDGIVTPSYGHGFAAGNSRRQDRHHSPRWDTFLIGNSRKNLSNACRRSSTAANA